MSRKNMILPQSPYLFNGRFKLSPFPQKKKQRTHQCSHQTWPLVVVEVQHVANGAIGDGRGEDRNVVASPANMGHECHVPSELTSPNHDRYMVVFFMAAILGDVQYPKNGTFTNPWSKSRNFSSKRLLVESGRDDEIHSSMDRYSLHFIIDFIDIIDIIDTTDSIPDLALSKSREMRTPRPLCQGTVGPVANRCGVVDFLGTSQPSKKKENSGYLT